MKSVFAVFLTIASVFTSSAFADTLDMSTVTCEATLAGSTEDTTTILIWLDGWLAGQADNTMLDPDQLGKQVEGILGICQTNGAMSLINAAKQYLGE